jgi:hypothetical protein
MEISLAQLVPAILAGAIGSAGTWFTLARSLVTRAEVERMVRDRVETLATAQARQEKSIDAMRGELVALTGEVIRLGVLLGVERSRERGSPAGRNKTKGS